MSIKTFNVDDQVYEKFSRHCKENGLSMSKQVTWFMQAQVEEEPKVRKSYLQKLERLKKGPFWSFNNVDDLMRSLGDETVQGRRKTR
ncbi:hypothetical protein JW711_04335 [Candidatus Woesearchaeota archaeon]|nr:hypothetical protein [Candidatus Woesearchaeota archaeon]